MDTATQDLVTRLSEAKNYIYHPRSQSVEDAAMRAIDDAIAALAAAPPADLVALVLECQREWGMLERGEPGYSSTRYEAAVRAVIAWRPSAPPEPAPLHCGCARGHCEASTPADCAVIQASAREAL